MILAEDLDWSLLDWRGEYRDPPPKVLVVTMPDCGDPDDPIPTEPPPLWQEPEEGDF